MKTDSFRFTKLIGSAHIADDSSATQVLWLLLAMARGKANKDYAEGECDPGIDYISIRTELSRSTVERALKWLTQLGLITTKIRGTPRNHQSSLYRLNYCELTALVEKCRETDERDIRAIRDREATKKRRQRVARSGHRDRDNNDCPRHGGGDRDGDVPVTEGACPRHDEVMSPSNGANVPVTERECPRHGDVLTTYELTNITNEYRNYEALAADPSEICAVIEKDFGTDGKVEPDQSTIIAPEQQAVEPPASGQPETPPTRVDPVQPEFQSRQSGTIPELERALRIAKGNMARYRYALEAAQRKNDSAAIKTSTERMQYYEGLEVDLWARLASPMGIV